MLFRFCFVVVVGEYIIYNSYIKTYCEIPVYSIETQIIKIYLDKDKK